jgi:chromosome segregation ATPase
MNQKSSTKLEKSTRRIDELMQERAGFEQNIIELQGRLKEQRKTHKGILNSILEFIPIVDGFMIWKLPIIAELKQLLNYKEGLLTDLKNMLYHRADEVEGLRKVMADMEKQLVDCLQQIKALGEEKEQR